LNFSEIGSLSGDINLIELSKIRTNKALRDIRDCELAFLTTINFLIYKKPRYTVPKISNHKDICDIKGYLRVILIVSEKLIV